MNVPRAIGAVLSSRMATIVELDTVLSMEDVYDMLEIIMVDAHNKQIAEKSED